MNTPICLAILAFLTAMVPAQAGPIEKEVTAAMNALRQATLNRDVAAMAKLLHPDLTYHHSNGSLQDRKAVLAKFAGAAVFEFSDATIRIQGNVALVNNTTDMRGGAVKDTPNLLNVLYVWVKGPEGWQMIARHPIKLPVAGVSAPPAKKGSA